MKRERKNRSGFYKGLALGAALSLGGAVLAGCVTNYVPRHAAGEAAAESESGTLEDINLDDRYGEVKDKLDDIQSMIDRYYIGDENVTEDDMVEGIYKGYVDALGEPYTTYYSKKEYDALKQSASGKYSGIGVVVSQDVKTGQITVIRPFEGSPGEEAGIKKDDILYKVDGKTVTGEDINEVVSWIKGEEGSSVEIEVYRPSEKSYKSFDVKRKTIEIPMVTYKMLDNKIGYIEIAEFEDTTYDQFSKAIDDLTSQGMEGMVLDLRDNPGGQLDAGQKVLDRILPKDKLLVYTVDKQGKKDELYSEDDDKIDVPMAVLINNNSASCSEIVSGCLQDYGRAVLVGTTSFGKGIVQYVIPMGDGSAMKMTSAKYYTPNGRNIHGTGIDPDVEAELPEEAAAQSDDGEQAQDTQLEKAEEAVLQQMKDK